MFFRDVLKAVPYIYCCNTICRVRRFSTNRFFTFCYSPYNEFCKIRINHRLLKEKVAKPQVLTDGVEWFCSFRIFGRSKKHYTSSVLRPKSTSSLCSGRPATHLSHLSVRSAINACHRQASPSKGKAPCPTKIKCLKIQKAETGIVRFGSFVI